MSARLLTGEVGPSLLRMAFPMLWGMLAVTLFNIVDTVYVGRLGTLPLAAMGYIFPVIFVVQCVTMGMSVATSSVLSRAIGVGDQARVRRIATDSLLLSMVLVGSLSVVGLLTIDPVFRLLGASPEIIVLIRTYMVPWYGGVFLLVVPMVGNSAIRATGDTWTPSLIMILAGVINIIMDPLLIFGIGPFPRLEMRGAAIATIISWIVTLVVAAWVLVRRLGLVDFRRPGWADLRSSWGQLLFVGLPAIGTNLLMPISTGILTRMLSTHGAEVVAAFGVATRLETLAMSGAFALSTILSPFVGQNFGGGRTERVVEGLRRAITYAFMWGAAVCVLYAVAARPLARLFNDHTAVVNLTAQYLWIVPVTYGFHGASAQVTATFNALNHPLRSTLIFTLRLFVFMLPLAFLGIHLSGPTGAFMGVAAANVLSAAVAGMMARRAVRALRSGNS